MTLTLVRDTRLDRATTYRLTSCLVAERFVDRGTDQSCRIGPEALLLGSLLPQPTPTTSTASASIAWSRWAPPCASKVAR